MPTPDDSEPVAPDAVAQPGEPAGDLAALFGGDRGVDLGALLQQASEMQEQMAQFQQQAAETLVEGVAGGGVVKVVMTAALEPHSVTISPDAVDPDDVEMLQDLVLAALRDAVDQAQELQSGAFGQVDLGGLGGLLGQ